MPHRQKKCRTVGIGWWIIIGIVLEAIKQLKLVTARKLALELVNGKYV